MPAIDNLKYGAYNRMAILDASKDTAKIVSRISAVVPNLFSVAAHFRKKRKLFGTPRIF